MQITSKYYDKETKNIYFYSLSLWTIRLWNVMFHAKIEVRSFSIYHVILLTAVNILPDFLFYFHCFIY